MLSQSTLLHVYALNLDYARRLIADLSAEQMVAQPALGMNHAAWVLGHLAWTCDFTGELLGVPPILGPAWAARFDYTSHPSENPADYPDKAELLEALERGHARVATAVAQTKPEQLAAPLPLEGFRDRYPTVGDLLLHLLTTHEATHLGQLSAWRRSLGQPPV